MPASESASRSPSALMDGSPVSIIQQITGAAIRIIITVTVYPNIFIFLDPFVMVKKDITSCDISVADATEQFTDMLRTIFISVIIASAPVL